MNDINKFLIKFPSFSENESFIRGVVSLFALRLNPSVSDLTDIKTAVSEAVTNAIVHGYPDSVGEIELECIATENIIHINVFDNGVGIDNLSVALEPFYTTKPEQERSGMGFTIMKSFMDSVKVESEKGKGTKIYMEKSIKSE